MQVILLTVIARIMSRTLPFDHGTVHHSSLLSQAGGGQDHFGSALESVACTVGIELHVRLH